MRNATLVLLMGCVLGAMLTGCGKPGLTKDNYDKISDGMTLAQVEKLLGPGKKGGSIAGAIGEIAGQGAAYLWEDGDKKITVVFKDDKVISKTQIGL